MLLVEKNIKFKNNLYKIVLILSLEVLNKIVIKEVQIKVLLVIKQRDLNKICILISKIFLVSLN